MRHQFFRSKGFWIVVFVLLTATTASYPIWMTWGAGNPLLAQRAPQSSHAGELATATVPATKNSPHTVELGTAVRLDPLTTEAEYRDTLLSHFTSVTPENALDFRYSEPRPGGYDFAAADAIVNFAHDHNLSIFGNGLVWFQAVPDWLKNGNYTRAQVIAILRSHIFTVVSRYRGRIDSWEVVDEALTPDGSALRDSFWLQTIGPDYIAMAFQWAHEADPDAALYYNEYGIEMPGPKFDALYALLKSLIKQHVPISGVGFQMHEDLTFGKPTMKGVAINFSRISALGLKIRITEMDVGSVMGSNLQEKLTEQANRYGTMATLCMLTKACVAFTVWGLTDKYTWIDAFYHRQDMPLLFDSNYKPKPAFYAVRSALKTP